MSLRRLLNSAVSLANTEAVGQALVNQAFAATFVRGFAKGEHSILPYSK